MKIAIFGAGAIGGYIGAKLARAGDDVTLIARGAHLAAMQTNGLRVMENDTEFVVQPRCLGDTKDAGPQDYVVIALKAHQLKPALPQLLPLLGPDTPVLAAQNGLPWWYFYKLTGKWQDHRVEMVDPGGQIWQTVGPERVLGCIVYPACEIVAPGVIRHMESDRLALGEPDGSRSTRLTLLAKTLINAGLRAPIRTRLRSEIWLKLWGNAVFNPLSVLTRGSLQDISTDPATRDFARRAMLEVQEIAAALGESMPLDVDARIDGAAEVGEHKTSMLQDFEAGRPLEIDAVTGATLEMARLTGVAAPNLEALDAMIRMLLRKTAEQAVR